jgi:SAM-dependent methyltransferase
MSTNGFDAAWDRRYAENTHLSVWPWSDVVSYVNRHLKPREDFTRILELGCGAGANIPFFLSRDDEYFAVEGSKTIVEQLKLKFPAISGNIVCGDFTKEIPFDRMFDAVLDRCSLTCNDTASIERCLKILRNKVRKDGFFIGIDWFSDKHADSRNGIAVDGHTRRDIESRQFGGVGNVHFSDQEHLMNLFCKYGFEIELLEHKESQLLLGAESFNICAMNFLAKRLS